MSKIKLVRMKSWTFKNTSRVAHKYVQHFGHVKIVDLRLQCTLRFKVVFHTYDTLIGSTEHIKHYVFVTFEPLAEMH